VVGRRSGPDGCPGALQAHRAGDGWLLRLRVPGGLLAADALAGLAGLAERYGDGELHLTSRGNVQLRGLRSGTDHTGQVVDPVLLEQIRSTGLLPSVRHERARNVIASPWSGRLGGFVDVAAVVGELDAGLCRDQALAQLSGRFLIALDDGTGDVAGAGADVTWWARSPTTGRLLIAGEDVGVEVDRGGVVRALLGAARSFLRLRDRSGRPAWRIDELPYGVAAVTEALLDGTRPAGRRGAAAVAGQQIPAPAAGLTALGAVRQDDGRWGLAGLVPLGRLSAAGARAVARAAGSGDRRVVLTPWRELLIADLPRLAVDAGQDLLAAAGLELSVGSPWRGLSACVGRPACGRALVDVRALADQVAREGSREAGVLHLSGCDRRCGAPRAGHREVVALPGETSERDVPAVGPVGR
jgi:precorrin-3B synthase